jgi:hypothetical protein
MMSFLLECMLQVTESWRLMVRSRRTTKSIFGAHAPDVLKMLGDEATHEELIILGTF